MSDELNKTDRLDVGALHAVIEAMSPGLLVVDSARQIVAVNQALVEMTGYAREDLIGRPCEVLQGDTCHTRRAASAFATCPLFTVGSICKRRCTIRRIDGSRLHLSKDAVTFPKGDAEARFGLEVLTDVTSLVARENEIALLRSRLAGEPDFHGMVGRSAPMRRLYEQLSRAAGSGAPVLLTGETGTGKELAARALHAMGGRAHRPFVAVNCAALNENLLESELFGHVRGAFTGASRTRSGRFEAARGGVLLVDEIGDLPVAVQVKLLRVLESGVVEKVGDIEPVDVDVRLIAATHHDLKQLVERGRFRRDLLYRLNAIPISIPPLRERGNDVALLAKHLLAGLRSPSGDHLTLDAAALRCLELHAWPGNIRELRGALDYAAVMSRDNVIHIEDLPDGVERPTVMPITPGMSERQRVREALHRTQGNKAAAARLLGISRVGLWKKLKRLDETAP